MRRYMLSGVALILIACMLFGCSSDNTASAEIMSVRVGETISERSKWINSSIEGAIAADTPVNPKDDFYTAVNKEWLLAQTLNEKTACINLITQPTKILTERKLAIVRGEGNSENGENPAEIPEAQLKHNEDLLIRFPALSSDWDTRNAEGVEPLRPYVQAIESIDTMDKMTDYMLNKDGKNITLIFPVNISVGSTNKNHTVNTVLIDVNNQYTLDSAGSYTNLSDAGKLNMQKSDASVKLLLGKLGYSEQQIRRIISACYRYEMRLADISGLVSGAGDIESYFDETDNRYTLEQLENIQGNFPLTDILKNYGYDHSETFCVSYPKYVSGMGLIYNERYLDEIKAFYLVHTLNDCMPLLDRGTFDELKKLENSVEEGTPKSKTDSPETDKTDTSLPDEDPETKIILDSFVGKYLSEPLDQVYVARYCTAEQKAKLKELIDDIRSYYKKMLYEEDWLSAQAREKAVEKLDNLTVRVLYPDSFTDYSGLDIDGCETLVDAVAAINAFTLTQRVDKINTTVDRTEWDMKKLPTTTVNAYYIPTENSINIFAGFIADDFAFNVDDSYEQTLAKIGTVIGHEITHAFDNNGYRFDKDGYYSNWWTNEDEQAFQLRTSRLSSYYSAIIPFPGGTGYNGRNVSGEAIADMGGIKCMLGIAGDIPDFDYDLFFKSYASLWKTKCTYGSEKFSSEKDVHPLGFLRVNVTLQQFEKFYETYDIKSGDGMYLAPEDRISVW